MSIFTKPISQLGTGDLQELLDEQAVENVRLEFKSEVPAKDETLKKLSSFANTFGGFIVVGAKAASSDGRITDLPGVDAQDGYKQKVTQWSFDGASPPLTVEVSDSIPAPAGGKVCYVIYVSESEVAPHFLNGRKGVWVRTDEFSSRFEARLADESELRHLLDRRRLILDRRTSLLERAKRRFDTFAAKTHTDRSGNRTALGPILEICIVPRFPARALCEQAQLTSLITGNYIRWRGVVFPNPSSGVISQHESALVLATSSEKTSLFEANIWGMLFYCTRIAANELGVFGMHLYGFVGHVLLYVRHAVAMLKALGYAGSVMVNVRLASIRNVPWLYGGSFIESHPGSDLDDEVAFSILTTMSELCEKPDGKALDILRFVFFSVNWQSLTGAPQLDEQLLRKGYTYNRWSGNLMI